MSQKKCFWYMKFEISLLKKEHYLASWIFYADRELHKQQTICTIQYKCTFHYKSCIFKIRKRLEFCKFILEVRSFKFKLEGPKCEMNCNFQLIKFQYSLIIVTTHSTLYYAHPCIAWMNFCESRKSAYLVYSTAKATAS